MIISLGDWIVIAGAVGFIAAMLHLAGVTR